MSRCGKNILKGYKQAYPHGERCLQGALEADTSDGSTSLQKIIVHCVIRCKGSERVPLLY